MFEAGKEELVDVVVKISKPRLMGGDLTYDIAVIEGKVPKKGGACSVFIDIIGLPFTPLSFAGVARRTMYRTVMWDTAVTNTQAAAVAKLKELKSLQKQGLITEAQYQAESQKILNQLVE